MFTDISEEHIMQTSAFLFIISSSLPSEGGEAKGKTKTYHNKHDHRQRVVDRVPEHRPPG